MSLTVREKDHWRYRIERKINRKIAEIEASEPVHVWKELARQAKQMALDDMKITEALLESKRLKEQVEELNRSERQVWARILAIFRGVQVEKIDLPSSFPYEVEREIERRKELFLKQLRSQHPKGQQIQSLENEKEELLDTVWLATSTSQIKELWSQIVDGLQFEVTPLQQKALAIDPVAFGSAIPSNE